MMVIKKYSDELFEVNSYVIKEGNHALVIDPITYEGYPKSVRDLAFDYIFITHEHYDHIAHVSEFKHKTRAKLVCSDITARGINDPKVNLLRYKDYLAEINYYGSKLAEDITIKCSVDQSVADGEVWHWQGHTILFKATPGHSRGGISLLLDGETLFAGDSLFKNHPVATRLPGGSSKLYHQETMTWYKSLPLETKVCPGHGEQFLLKDRYKE